MKDLAPNSQSVFVIDASLKEAGYTAGGIDGEKAL